MHCGSCGAAISENDKYCVKCGKLLTTGDGDARWTPSRAALDSTDFVDESAFAYSGFWRRVGAALIDGVLIWVVALVLALASRLVFASGGPDDAVAVASGLLWVVFWLLAPWLYFSLMECSAQQATLGKLAVGVKVTDLAGRRIGFGRATGRYFGKWISQLIMYIGYIMVAFTARRQGLHDMMAGTVVVLRAPSPAALAAGAAAGRPVAGGIILVIILACMVPVFGILAAIAIPAYRTYTLRAQVSEGLTLAAALQAEVAQSLQDSEGPMAGILASMKVDPVSGMFVSSVELSNGAIVITFGNEADSLLDGETLALVPERDGEGRLSWVCGHRPVHTGLEQGNPDPGSLTSLPPKYLPTNCRP